MVRVLPEKVRPQFAHAHLWRPCSFPNFFRRLPWQYGHSPKKVLDLLRRSKTWSLKQIGMVLSGSSGAAHRGKVAISSCSRPWNSYDIARGLYRILRIATLLFILLPEFFSKLGIQSEEILDGRTDILLQQTTGTDSNPRGPCHLGKGRHRESTMEGTAVTESKRQNAPVFHPV